MNKTAIDEEFEKKGHADIRGRCLNTNDAAYIASKLKVNDTLVTINLSFNDIGAEGALVIAGVLALTNVNTTLSTINLGCNGIGDKGAYAIAETLKTNHTLTNVNLHNNNVGAEGAIAIAQALHVNRTLKAINLNSNAIGDEGAITIAEAMKVNRTITALELTNTAIGDTGATAIGNTLEVNGTLQRVIMRQNYAVSRSTAEALQNAVLVRTKQNLAVDPALACIFPSSCRKLWPAAAAAGTASEEDDDTEDTSNALIDSFFCSPICDVQVFRIIRAYMIKPGFTGRLRF
jgi:Ran GTPase-activating protein (RanGAP) involved in mRNA processing and transport